MIDGSNISNPIFEAHYKAYLARLVEAAKTNTKVYFLFDLETGCPFEVSKAEHDNYKKSIELVFAPKLKGKGKAIIIGTGEPMEGNYSFKKLWDESKG